MCIRDRKEDPKKFLGKIEKFLELPEHEWDETLLTKKIKSGSAVENYSDVVKSKPKMPKVVQSVVDQVYLPKLEKLKTLVDSKYLDNWISKIDNNE